MGTVAKGVGTEAVQSVQNSSDGIERPLASPELYEALGFALELVDLLAANCSDRVDISKDPRLPAARAALAKAARPVDPTNELVIGYSNGARERLREDLIKLFYRERVNEDDAALSDKAIEYFDEAVRTMDAEAAQDAADARCVGQPVGRLARRLESRARVDEYARLYQWLRDQHNSPSSQVVVMVDEEMIEDVYLPGCEGMDLDAAIRAAIAKGQSRNVSR